MSWLKLGAAPAAGPKSCVSVWDCNRSGAEAWWKYEYRISLDIWGLGTSQGTCYFVPTLPEVVWSYLLSWADFHWLRGVSFFLLKNSSYLEISWCSSNFHCGLLCFVTSHLRLLYNNASFKYISIYKFLLLIKLSIFSTLKYAPATAGFMFLWLSLPELACSNLPFHSVPVQSFLG